MKKALFLTCCFMASAVAMADDYATTGDGTVWTMQALSETAGSGVSGSDGSYRMTESVTISEGDVFDISGAREIVFSGGAELIIAGEPRLSAVDPVVFRHEDGSSGSKSDGIRLTTSEGEIAVSNLHFTGVGLRNAVGSDCVVTVTNCSFTGYDGSASSALMLGGSGATFHVSHCTFEGCQKAAIGGAANYYCPVVIEDCEFFHNGQSNSNTPQLNLTVASDVTVRRCVVTGDPDLTMVGGIGLSNFMAADDVHVTIDHCDISDNRYGIGTVGPVDIRITDNLLSDNNHETNPMNGGSGISLYDPYMRTTAMISGNRIERSLWGVTVIGCSKVNLGRTGLDESDADYNPGGNEFEDNGNGGTWYDLYNNSANTVWAQNCHWNVEVQDAEHIEAVVYHKYDDSNLGEVMFTPAMEQAGIEQPFSTVATGRTYDLRGIEITQRPLPHGIYIKDGKKHVR